jgi:1-phosphofructokinase
VAEKRNDGPRMAVIAPSPIVTVTVEQVTTGHPEIHFHPGVRASEWRGWRPASARRMVLCAPIGGESGRVLKALLVKDGIELRGVPSQAPNGAYVHDRRSGERVELAAVPSPALSRHGRTSCMASL